MAVVRVQGAVQHYAWGRGRQESLVHLLASRGAAYDVGQEEQWAELWLGTHPKGPLRPHPSQQGEVAVRLPFLLKCLSVGRSLSLQAHPTRKQARQLHARSPDVYRDPNHKPELALALTPFRALCGFLPAREAVGRLRQVGELRQLLGRALEQTEALADKGEEEEALRTLFGAVARGGDAGDMQAMREAVLAMTARIRQELQEEEQKPNQKQEEGRWRRLVVRLGGEHEGDVGVALALLLQEVELQAGQAVFLDAGVPHAYLQGECVEVMACSDNVVRAGLTGKLRDVPTLLHILRYSSAPTPVLGGSSPYEELEPEGQEQPREFRLARMQLGAGTTAKYPPAGRLEAPALLLVVEGAGSVRVVEGAGSVQAEVGCCFLAQAGQQVEVSAGPEGLLLFACTCDAACMQQA